MENVIHWITEHKEENSPNRKVSHSHPDPTADEAISKAAHVISHHFETPWTEHAFLEPECAVAFYDECLESEGGKAG